MAVKKNFNLNPVLYRLFEVEPSKGELRKAKIIETAISQIAHDGIENVSYESIGKALKIRRSHVAYYFKDREEMLELIIKYITAMAQSTTIDRIKDESDPRKQALGIIHGAFDWAATHPDHISVLLLFYYYCGYKPEYRKLMMEIRTVGATRLATLFEQIPGTKKKLGLKAGRLIQAIVMGALFEYFATAERRASKELEEARKNTLEAIEELIT